MIGLLLTFNSGLSGPGFPLLNLVAKPPQNITTLLFINF